jgi:hypothetical protein
MDVLMSALITDVQYKLPQLAPDGNYCPTPSAITEIHTERKLMKIIDVLGRKIQNETNQPLFYIYDNGTVEKRIVIE